MPFVYSDWLDEPYSEESLFSSQRLSKHWGPAAELQFHMWREITGVKRYPSTTNSQAGRWERLLFRLPLSCSFWHGLGKASGVLDKLNIYKWLLGRLQCQSQIEYCSAGCHHSLYRRAGHSHSLNAHLPPSASKQPTWRHRNKFPPSPHPAFLCKLNILRGRWAGKKQACFTQEFQSVNSTY